MPRGGQTQLQQLLQQQQQQQQQEGEVVKGRLPCARSPFVVGALVVGAAAVGSPAAAFGHLDDLSAAAMSPKAAAALASGRVSHGGGAGGEATLEDYYAILIQSARRRVLARRRLEAVAVEVFEMLWDPCHEEYYFFHTATGESLWAKPKCLGERELPLTEEQSEVVPSASTVEAAMQPPKEEGGAE